MRLKRESQMALWTLWANCKHFQNALNHEDERVALSKRFRDEGFDIDLSDGQKLPYVWRWLVDAETNCLSLRHQNDKLHRQHENDLKEVEEYLEQMWKLASDRITQLETDNRNIKKELSKELSEKSTNLITGEENQEIVINNLSDSLKLKSGFKQIFQNSRGDTNESEIIKYQQSCESSDNLTVVTNQNNSGQLKSLQDMCNKMRHQITDADGTIRTLEMAKRELEMENETLSYKLSESLTQCDQLEHALLKLESSIRLSSNIHHYHNKHATNTIDSPVNESRITNSSEEMETSSAASDNDKFDTVHSMVESKVKSTSNDIRVMKQLQELKIENEKIRKELTIRNQQFENLANKYEKRKSRHKERMVRLRDYIERENRQIQEMLRLTDRKRVLVEEELQRQRQMCAILESDAKNRQLTHD